MTVYAIIRDVLALGLLAAIYGATARAADALEAATDPVVVEQTFHAPAPGAESLGDELDRIRDCEGGAR